MAVAALLSASSALASAAFTFSSASRTTTSTASTKLLAFLAFSAIASLALWQFWQKIIKLKIGGKRGREEGRAAVNRKGKEEKWREGVTGHLNVFLMSFDL